MSTISYRLDLLINLIDTTTGRAVTDSNVLFYKDGEALLPEARGDGLFLLLNTGRNDFELSVKVYGYEDYHGYVKYETLSEREPIYAVYLNPVDDPWIGEAVLSYRGRIPKLEAIEAVTLFKARCAASEYNVRRQELSVFRMDGSKSMPDVHYGLLQGQKNTYTHIEVEKDISDTKVKLAKPLTEKFSPNTPMYRVIFGQVEPDGSFVLKVRDAAAEIPVIVRYRIGGEWYAQQTEFHTLVAGGAEDAKKETNEEEDAA